MTQAITSFDLSVLYWMQSHLRNPVFTPILQFISFLGNSGWFFVLLALIFLIFRKSRRLGIFCAVSMILQTILVNLILKILIARPRPYDLVSDLTPLIKKLTDFSFPSGHTSVSVCIAVTCLLAGWKKTGILLAVLSILMGFSRLYLGVHYPSDVLGGAIAGAVGALIGTALVRRAEKYRSKNIRQ